MTPHLLEALRRWHDLYTRQPQDPWDREDLQDELEQAQEELAEAFEERESEGITGCAAQTGAVAAISKTGADSQSG